MSNVVSLNQKKKEKTTKNNDESVKSSNTEQQTDEDFAHLPAGTQGRILRIRESLIRINSLMDELRSITGKNTTDNREK